MEISIIKKYIIICVFNIMEIIFDNIDKTIPKILAIFVFILIVSGNYLGELFPCRVQRILSDSMLMKHLLGYLTLIFFVVLTIPELQNSPQFIKTTLIVYFSFLLLAKTYYKIWFVIFTIVGIVYLIDMYKTSIEKNEKDNVNKDKQTHIINIIQYILVIIIIIFTIIGFLTYMGNKKIEYKKSFNYLTFFFGKPKCREISPKFPGYIKSIYIALTK